MIDKINHAVALMEARMALAESAEFARLFDAWRHLTHARKAAESGHEHFAKALTILAYEEFCQEGAHV